MIIAAKQSIPMPGSRNDSIIDGRDGLPRIGSRAAAVDIASDAQERRGQASGKQMLIQQMGLNDSD